GDLPGRRRRTHLQRLRRRPARRLPRHGRAARAHARGGRQPPPPPDRAVPPEVRRAHPPDPPAGRQGLRTPQADLAGPPAGTAGIGAGIGRGVAEALSDDGSLTGRGRPLARGIVCGMMTALGGLGHTLPYLIPDVYLATGIAIVVVLIELGIIAWVRHRFMDT